MRIGCRRGIAFLLGYELDVFTLHDGASIELVYPNVGIYIAYIESVCLQRYQEATERNGVHD